MAKKLLLLLFLAAVAPLVGGASGGASPGTTPHVGVAGHSQVWLQSSATNLSGTWSVDFHVSGFSGLGHCSATLVQDDSAISGEASCTYASGGSLSGTLVGTTLSLALAFTTPPYVVTASASVSSDATSMSGIWECTNVCSYSGTFTATKVGPSDTDGDTLPDGGDNCPPVANPPQ